MNVKLSELRRYAPALPLEAVARLAERLTLSGVEVGRVRPPDILELEITTNRPDLLSFAGIARELAALEGVPFALPASTLVEDVSEATSDVASLSIEAAELCPRYTARIVRGVSIGPSPAWLVAALDASGIRPISNIVDITNFVLLELGQPLHAFDLDKLAGRHIVVRRARPGERLTTLDGQERCLVTDDLVIADAERAQALAGVMGGRDSEVGPTTTDVLIESAWFAPLSTRKTARRHALRTEASLRFERGTDPGGTLRAADRAAALMAELAGGRVLEGALDAYPRPVAPVVLRLRAARVAALLGYQPTAAEMTRVLAALGFTAAPDGDGAWQVSVPSFRGDVSREIDLIEEVGRQLGYERVPASLPRPPAAVRQSGPRARAEAALRDVALGAGLSECVNLAFTNAELNARFAPDGARPVRLLNPLSDRLAELEMSLLPGLLEAVRTNVTRGNPDIALFELATRFAATADRPSEVRGLALVLAGERARHWSHSGGPHDVWDAKGLVELCCAALGLPAARFESASAPGYLAGSVARVLTGDLSVGLVGELDPAALQELDIEVPVMAAELDVTALSQQLGARHRLHAPSRFQAATRDVSFLVSGVSWQQIETRIGALAEPTIESMELLDRYQGKGLPSGSTSLTLRVRYRSPDATLDADELQRLDAKVRSTLAADSRITLRE